VLALAYAGFPRGDLDPTLSYMARSLTTPTGLFGEAWRRFAGGRPTPLEDMPHVWAHSLFYLAAVQADGSRPYSFARSDVWRRACRHAAAPPSACRH